MGPNENCMTLFVDFFPPKMVNPAKISTSRLDWRVKNLKVLRASKNPESAILLWISMDIPTNADANTSHIKGFPVNLFFIFYSGQSVYKTNFSNAAIKGNKMEVKTPIKAMASPPAAPSSAPDSSAFAVPIP